MIDIKIKRLYKDSLLPQKQHAQDAAFDCFVHSIEVLSPNRIKIGLGFAVQVPEGYMLNIVPRSSIGKTNWLLSNSFGVVDSGYCKEVFAVFTSVRPHWDCFPFSIGERCCQCFLMPVLETAFTEVEEIEGTREGFGSTGK